MSWLSKVTSKASQAYGNAMSKMMDYSIAGNISKAITGTNQVSDFYQREFVDKADLRGAEVVSGASGLPVIGNIVKGIEGVNQLEDLYNNTGKVPEYPGATNQASARGLGSGIPALSQKIEDGSHDLSEFYSGDRSLDDVFENVNGWQLVNPWNM